jgi:3-dehydroquinate synthase
MTNAKTTVRISLGERSYDVVIGPGLAARSGDLIATRFPSARCAVVTDSNLTARHLPALVAGLTHRHAGTIVLKPGEASKSFSELGALCERLLALGLERGDLVIAFGGGVIGDLAGLAASIVRRGVRLVQIPSTLLAQVDASIGGKTAINTAQGKNLVGTFHQPSLVITDTELLATLPPREMRAGYAEVVKYGLLGNAAFFAWLEANFDGLLGHDSAALAHAIATGVRAKAAIVARDELENNDRMRLNLGHTFGHALEAWAGFSARLLHGEAVAIGMAQAFRFSVELGHTSKATADRVAAHLSQVGLPTRIADIPGNERPDVANLMRLMRQDKKVSSGKFTLILARGIGDTFVTRDVAADRLADFLAREII